MADIQSYVRDWNDVRYQAQAAYAAYKLIQGRDGRAQFLNSANGASLGDFGVPFKPDGQVTVPKAASVALLDGMPAYWDRTNSVLTFKRLGANRGFYAGRVVGDALGVDSTATVNLNINPPDDLNLHEWPWTTALIGTPAAGGFGEPRRRGGAQSFVLSSTSEAQKVDALGDDPIVVGAKGIIRIRVKVIGGGAGATAKFNVGMASATHATSVDSITQHLMLHLNSNDTAIYFQSKDGVNTQAAVSSTKTFTAGTAFEAWLDFRNPASVGLYVDGVQVLTSTVFNISSGGANWFLLAHLVKTATAEVMEVEVDWCRFHAAEQSVKSA